MTFSAWFEVMDNPSNRNLESFGGADCAAIGLKQDFLDTDFKNEDWDYSELKNQFEQDLDFKWFSTSCYFRTVPHVNLQLSPLCKM